MTITIFNPYKHILLLPFFVQTQPPRHRVVKNRPQDPTATIITWSWLSDSLGPQVTAGFQVWRETSPQGICTFSSQAPQMIPIVRGDGPWSSCALVDARQVLASDWFQNSLSFLAGSVYRVPQDCLLYKWNNLRLHVTRGGKNSMIRSDSFVGAAAEEAGLRPSGQGWDTLPPPGRNFPVVLIPILSPPHTLPSLPTLRQGLM